MLGRMPAAISLGPGLWRVPTAPWDLVNSFLVRAPDGSFTLVDTGTASAPSRVLAALGFPIRGRSGDSAESVILVGRKKRAINGIAGR